ncbi:hypothetical protein FKM82_018063 [Ascaphus truei]
MVWTAGIGTANIFYLQQGHCKPPTRAYQQHQNTVKHWLPIPGGGRKSCQSTGGSVSRGQLIKPWCWHSVDGTWWEFNWVVEAKWTEPSRSPTFLRQSCPSTAASTSYANPDALTDNDYF